ncbi:MAG: hypothetical protein ILP19_03450 [Oscillospiraceae bacterium]|nr:hypothetical protein [Oscillospiraceae bacterium]
MIPILMMIGGVIVGGYGFVMVLYVLITPHLVKLRTVNGQGEIIETRRIRRIRIKDRVDLIKLFGSLFIIGLLIFAAGYYLGFSARGQGIWFYDLVYGSEDKSTWDKIDDNGSYIAENGGTYRYYLVIEGSEYEFCGEKCEDIDDLEKRLVAIGRENTVVVIDSYAVYSARVDAEKLLSRLGMKYETEEI